ncbi:hypothetical protein A3K62_00675 [Candidatus Pacearchaeota archaeon RBG_16_35_8]|nr:MAG: hypothetical protein A3K62_00675 [Candidatus Pacearchaeota archaeon RBG_16_35_8]
MVKKKSLIEFLKYASVGFSGIFVNLLFLWFFTEVLYIYYLVSAIFSFFIATLSNFLLNKVWTFRENVNHKFLAKGIKFFAVAFFSLFVNIFFLWFFTEIVGIYYLISQVLASGFTLISNFTGNKLWTFKR